MRHRRAGQRKGAAKGRDRPEERTTRISESDIAFLQRHFIETGLEPFKVMVERGEIDPQTAIGLMTREARERSGDARTPEYRKFNENSRLLFEKEIFFEAVYYLPRGRGYRMTRASSDDYPLFEMYRRLSGEPYSSPEQLGDIMRKILKGKSVLELGCGPGFYLKVLKDLGARVSGVELLPDLVGGVPGAGVKVGDAERLDDIFPRRKFDIIFSCDFFCEAVMDRVRSARIATAMHRHTKSGGMGIHGAVYWEIPAHILLFDMWVTARERGLDFSIAEEDYWSKSAKERMLFTNTCSLDLHDLEWTGFERISYSTENRHFSLVMNKPG